MKALNRQDEHSAPYLREETAASTPAGSIHTTTATESELEMLRETVVMSLLQSIRTKRTRSDQESSEDDEFNSSLSDASQASRKAKKLKKPSYLIRKEEQEALRKQVEQLEAHVTTLRQEAGIPNAPDPQITIQKITANNALREALHQQQLHFASAQSAVSEYVNSQRVSPLETYIHLSKDWDERRATLVAIKTAKLQTAHDFLKERTRFMNLTKMSREESHFQTADGGSCSIIFDITPFEGAKSVSQVFDALRFYLMNMEITMSEHLGNITVREDTEQDGETSILQHRLVTSLSNGTVYEKNGVKFFELFNASDGSQGSAAEDAYALLATDFVNEDDLYPYVTAQRVRTDVTAAMKIFAYRNENGDLVVMLISWLQFHIRHTNIKLPSPALRQIQTLARRMADVSVDSMNQYIYG